MKEKTTHQTYHYRGKIVNLRVDDVLLSNGHKAIREVIEHPGGVGVLPIQGDHVYLVKQLRYPYQEILYEIPAGKLEKDESPIETGLRELREEIGAVTEELISLGKIYPSPGYINEIVYLYYTDSFFIEANALDEDEFLEIEVVSIEEVMNMIDDGRIVDAKTIVAILKYQEKVRKNDIKASSK